MMSFPNRQQLLLLAALCGASVAVGQTSTQIVTLALPGNGAYASADARGAVRDLKVQVDGRPADILSADAIQGHAQVLLVLDTINAPQSLVASEANRLALYLEAAEARLPLPTGIAILTNTRVNYLPGYTTDAHKLAADLRAATLPQRLFNAHTDGEYAAVEQYHQSLNGLSLLVQQASGTRQRTQIVFVSHGWPLLNSPRFFATSTADSAIFATLADLSVRMRQAGVTLYDLNLTGPEEDRRRYGAYRAFTAQPTSFKQVAFGNLGLERLAEDSGGFVSPLSNVAGATLQKIYAEGQNWYRVQLRVPASGEPQFHFLTASVGGRELPARRGFYTADLAQTAATLHLPEPAVH